MTEIGKIQTASTRLAYCDVDETIREGDLVSFNGPDGPVRARVAHLQTGIKGRNIAHIEYLDATPRVPNRGTPIFAHKEAGPGGLDFSLGTDIGKRTMAFRLNAFFRHVLIAGMTQQGKTHLEIALLEMIAQWNVPVLIIDPQAEFKHLPTVLKNCTRTEDQDQVLPLVRMRKVVVLDVQADGIETRRLKAAAVLRELFETQEQASAEGKPFPPVLVFLDEADSFAPSNRLRGDECRDAMIEVAKRGSKLGLGLVLASQRPTSIHIDVRSQLNGAFFFRLTDSSSRIAMRDMGLTKYDTETIQRLQVGECLVVGVVASPTRMRVKRIETQRVRSDDFEGLLQKDDNPAPAEAVPKPKGGARV